jgi:alanine racemase
VLLGRGDREVIAADEIAAHTGTIPYEILCNISKRVKRVYI